jgi:uncharacterized membrane protein
MHHNYQFIMYQYSKTNSTQNIAGQLGLSLASAAEAIMVGTAHTAITRTCTDVHMLFRESATTFIASVTPIFCGLLPDIHRTALMPSGWGRPYVKQAGSGDA